MTACPINRELALMDLLPAEPVEDPSEKKARPAAEDDRPHEMGKST
jgi:hypothetical protein